jgi:NADH-quinone oxidoreductase subunit N
MIYGVSLLYGTHGSLDVIAIADSIRKGDTLALTTVIGLLAVFVGLLFKISGVPMHFWAPDVLEGTTADIAAFLSVASKGAGLILLARLATILAPSHESLMSGIAITISIVSVASMIVGNLGAMQQTSLKRMLAFSSIAHAGYMLAAVAMVLPGQIDDAMIVLGIYLSIYLFMQLGAFAVVGEVEARSGNDRVDSFRGLITLAPLSAIGLAVAMLSMIGLPPFGGFWAKLLVMVLLAQQGGWWWVIVASVAINSIISIGFYGRVLRAMFLERPVADAARHGPSAGLIGAGCALALLGLFIFLSPLESTSTRMADQVRSVLPAGK